jgi:hypothetical protein
VAVDESRQRWAQWVDAQIGGDVWRRRAAFEAAIQTLQRGGTTEDAASAAHAAAARQPAELRCRFCGSTPAVAMTVYEHNGYVILMQFKNLKGPFCRSCGLHAWRQMTDQTLLRGWLGVFSFFIAPITALINLINLRKLEALPPPYPGTAVRQPADPGGGLFSRPGVYVYAAVIVVVFIWLAAPAIFAR